MRIHDDERVVRALIAILSHVNNSGMTAQVQNDTVVRFVLWF